MKKTILLIMIILVMVGCELHTDNKNEINEYSNQESVDLETGERIYNDEYVINKIEVPSEYKVIDYFMGKQPVLKYKGRSGKGEAYIEIEGTEDYQDIYKDEDVIIRLAKDANRCMSVMLYTGDDEYVFLGGVPYIRSSVDNLSNGDILEVDLNTDKMKEYGCMSDVEPFKIRVTKLPELFKKGDEIDIEKVKKLISDNMIEQYRVSADEIEIKNIMLTECVDETKIIDEVTSKVGKHYNYVSVYYECATYTSATDDSNTYVFTNLYDDGDKYKFDIQTFLNINEGEDIKTCFDMCNQIGDGYESTIIY